MKEETMGTVLVVFLVANRAYLTTEQGEKRAWWSPIGLVDDRAGRKKSLVVTNRAY
jgi:hypothetical protein